MCHLNISPQWLAGAVQSPLLYLGADWGRLVGIVRERSPRASQQFSPCGKDAVHMHREADSSVTMISNSAHQMEQRRHRSMCTIHRAGSVFAAFPLSHNLRLGISTYSFAKSDLLVHVRLYAGSRSACRCKCGRRAFWRPKLLCPCTVKGSVENRLSRSG